MTTIAIGNRSQLALRTINLMYEFRYEVFVRRLGWSLQSSAPAETAERDAYDTEDTVYLVASDEQQRVTACARLLTSTRPYMLPDVFPQLLGRMAAPHDPGIWELSRFAANVRETCRGRTLGLSAQTLELLDSIIRFAQGRAVRRLLLVTTIAIERLLMRARLDSHRIAPPACIDGAPCVALFIEVPQSHHRYASCESMSSIEHPYAASSPDVWNSASSNILSPAGPAA